MKHRRIENVMTREVVQVDARAPFKRVAGLLAEHRISGLPVTDAAGRVLGVVSEADLLTRQSRQEDLRRTDTRQHNAPAWLRQLIRGRAGWREAARAHAATAGELMSAPAVTVRPEDTVTDAARTMTRHGVKRLPVVGEDGRLVGIVTRHDLLRVFLRRDAEIGAEVANEVLAGTLWLARNALDITVQNGVVTLKGQLERRSEIPIALRMTERIDGVVSVVHKLTYRLDDAHIPPVGQGLRAADEAWMHRL
ncbi:CBS domain-containing protein [Streptomyces iconiensis]|uniref:CBS domain-containing protein n=1 Tax=Streptomyces iconiensis TaxID=1384038 RepID=A0ABT7A2E5_9ACTN|nr:CBS domain-containing protein [Streptomyces iconiensis]MDJ1135495.1 CBS domain-containing protein [Streptomyces iconiensis]